MAEEDPLDGIAKQLLQQLRAIPEESAVREPVRLLNALSAPLLATRRPAARISAPQVEALLSELPQTTQQVVRLHLARDLTYRQIARELGIAADVALHQLTAGLTQFRKRLTARECTGVPEQQPDSANDR